MHQRADGLKVAGAFAAIYVLWGGTYLAIALGLQSIPAFILIASRSLIGGGVLLLLSYFRGSELRPLGDWGHAAVGGAFLFMGCQRSCLCPATGSIRPFSGSPGDNPVLDRARECRDRPQRAAWKTAGAPSGFCGSSANRLA